MYAYIYWKKNLTNKLSSTFKICNGRHKKEDAVAEGGDGPVVEHHR
jgi:hypothetical protein